MATTTTEKTSGWTKAGSVYTFLVKDHGKVTFDRSKASQAMLDFFMDYGIGRIFPDRTSSLKGLNKLEGMRKLIALAESGAETLSIRETTEERLAREQAAAKVDLFEALGRLGYAAEKAAVMLKNFATKNKWGEPQAVTALSGQKDVSAMILRIKQERALERAKPGPEIDLEKLFGDE